MFPVSLTKWHYTEVADPRQLHCVKVVKVLRVQGNPLCDSPGWEGLVNKELTFLEQLNDLAISSNPELHRGFGE